MFAVRILFGAMRNTLGVAHRVEPLLFEHTTVTHRRLRAGILFKIFIKLKHIFDPLMADALTRRLN